jgi:hypothetical protein
VDPQPIILEWIHEFARTITPGKIVVRLRRTPNFENKLLDITDSLPYEKRAPTILNNTTWAYYYIWADETAFANYCTGILYRTKVNK